MSKVRALALAALVGLPLMAGCVVHGYVPVPAVAVAVAPPPPACQAVWIRPHYDRWGYWHHGHWRCVG